MTELENGTKILFRKDFGEKSHKIGGPYKDQGKVDHYNTEVQKPNGNKSEDIHIVSDGNGGYIWFGNNGVVKP